MKKLIISIMFILIFISNMGFGKSESNLRVIEEAEYDGMDIYVIGYDEDRGGFHPNVEKRFLIVKCGSPRYPFTVSVSITEIK